MPKVVVTLQSYLATLRDTHENVPTQKELASIVGLSYVNFNKIANNKRDHLFTRAQLALIITALREYDSECDVGDLVRYVG